MVLGSSLDSDVIVALGGIVDCLVGMALDGKQAVCVNLFLFVLISADPPLRYVNLSAPLSLPFPHHNGARLVGTKGVSLWLIFTCEEAVSVLTVPTQAWEC